MTVLTATDRKTRGLSLRPALMLGFAALSLLAVIVSYQLHHELTLEVGSPGDTAFLAPGTFYADEADIDYRYRWSTGHAEVDFVGAGSAPVTGVSITSQAPRPSGAAQPVTMSVSLNGDALANTASASGPGVVDVDDTLRTYSFSTPPSQTATLSSPYNLAIDVPTFRPPGDARDLGIKVDSVRLVQANEFNWPPGYVLLWQIVLVLGLFGIFSAWGGRWALWLPVALSLLGLLPVLLSPLFNAAYMPPVAAFLGLLGLLVWQRERFARWPEVVDLIKTSSLASQIMVAALVIYAALALTVLPQIDWIGHADYAENAVIARNLVEGRGLTVDYMAQFYTDHGPGITHPADTWPFLQPIMIAPFFALFGTATWAAKLPNLLVMLALAWAVFVVASRLWDQRVGLMAALFTLVHPYFFNSVLYPINDLPFTLIFLVLAWLVWRTVTPVSNNGRFSAFSALAAPSTRTLVYLGLLAGLLIWSKPSGASLLVGLAVWALWAWWRSPRGKVIAWGRLGILVGSAVLVLLPLLIRNLLTLHTPYFSTESYDAWILRYWPLHDWEDIYKNYLGKELPHPRWIVGGKFGYQNLVDAITTNFTWFWQKGIASDPRSGDYIFGILPLSGALVGLAAAPRRIWSLFGMLGLSFGLYFLFVMLYWHFEGRYFGVMVPWLYMLLAWALFWVWDRLRSGSVEFGVVNKVSGPALLLLPLAAVALLWPSISAMMDQVSADTQPTGFVADMRWLKENSSPSDIIMTRDPWELNWYTGRKAVMIPNDDLTTIESTARKYGVTMLQLGGPVDGIDTRRCPSTVGSRSALDGLYCGQERPGYKLVFREGGLTIYRLTGR